MGPDFVHGGCEFAGIQQFFLDEEAVVFEKVRLRPGHDFLWDREVGHLKDDAQLLFAALGF